MNNEKSQEIVDFRIKKWYQKTKMLEGINSTFEPYAHFYQQMKFVKESGKNVVKFIGRDGNTGEEIDIDINSLQDILNIYNISKNVVSEKMAENDAYSNLFRLLVKQVQLDPDNITAFNSYLKKYLPDAVNDFISTTMTALGVESCHSTTCTGVCCLTHESKNIELYTLLLKLCEKIDLPLEIGKENIYGRPICIGFLLTLFVETLSCKRGRYHREYDRIVVSTAFQHLQYKTQVMINSASDDQRTRLLHSLEVQKCAKTLAEQLGANWELAEEIALAHDVGHTPFGHSGERQLDKCLHSNFFGRFVHPIQSVKVLDFLEHHQNSDKYGLRALLLAKTVLRGVLQHDRDSFSENLGDPGFMLQYVSMEKFLEKNEDNAAYLPEYFLPAGTIEAQIVHWSDKFAYLGHDWEEFADSGLLENMLSTLNETYFKMCKITAIFQGLESSMSSKSKERSLILQIVEKIRELNKIIVIDKGSAPLEKDELIKNIDSLLETEDKKIDSENFIILTKDEYKMIYDFFRVAKAWIGLVDITPIKSEAGRDILFVIYEFLKHRINSRTVMNKVQDLLLEGTNEAIEELKDMKKLNNKDDFKNYCTDNLKDLYKETEEKYETCKNKKDKIDFIKDNLTQKSFLVKMSSKPDNYNQTNNDYLKIINDFKFDYYIKSTEVKFMTSQAEKIINELFYFFFKHFNMIPLHFRKHKNFYKNSRFQEYLIKYLEQVLSDICEYEVKGHVLIAKTVYEQAMKSETNSTNGFKDLMKYLDIQEHNGNYRLGSKGYDEYIEKAIEARIVADYIASMSDRMATLKYEEIMSSSTKWSVDYKE